MTPVGLRRAAPRPGDPDPGAHPCLLGDFARAALAAGVPREDLVALVESAADALLGGTPRGVLGHVPERVASEPPHASLARPADALGASELLRLLVLDLAAP